MWINLWLKLHLAVAAGLMLSGIALLIAAGVSMGHALQEPAVVVPIMVIGPTLSVITWIVLSATARRPAKTKRGKSRAISTQESSPLKNLFMIVGGACLSLPVFIGVVMVETQFPGEERSDVFGPYYTHPFRPLSGMALCLLGLLTGAFLYQKLHLGYCSLGLSFGCIALGLVLIFAK